MNVIAKENEVLNIDTNGPDDMDRTKEDCSKAYKGSNQVLDMNLEGDKQDSQRYNASQEMDSGTSTTHNNNHNNHTNVNVPPTPLKLKTVPNPYKIKLLGNKVWITDQDDIIRSKNTPRSRGQRGQQVGKQRFRSELYGANPDKKEMERDL